MIKEFSSSEDDREREFSGRLWTWWLNHKMSLKGLCWFPSLVFVSCERYRGTNFSESHCRRLRCCKREQLLTSLITIVSVSPSQPFRKPFLTMKVGLAVVKFDLNTMWMETSQEFNFNLLTVKQLYSDDWWYITYQGNTDNRQSATQENSSSVAHSQFAIYICVLAIDF